MTNTSDNGYWNHVCPVFGSGGEEYHKVGDYHIDRCKRCEFAYVRNVPSKEFVSNYNRGMFGARDNFSFRSAVGKQLKNWYLANRIRQCAKPDHRRLLEIGFGYGFLLTALHRQGRFDLEGIDHGGHSVEQLKSLGLKVSLSSLEERKYPDASFDIVVGMHVLEHVQSLNETVGELRRILSPGGRVFLQVPCVTHYRARLAGKQWKHFSAPSHLWFFGAKSMKLFLSKNGFQVIFARCLSNRAHLTVLAEKT